MKMIRSSSYKSTISYPVFWMRTPRSTTVWGRGCPTGSLSFGPFLKAVTNHLTVNHVTIRRRNWFEHNPPNKKIHRCLIYIFFLREHEYLPPLEYHQLNVHILLSQYNWVCWSILRFKGGNSLLLWKLKSLTALTRLQGKLAFLFTIV